MVADTVAAPGQVSHLQHRIHRLSPNLGHLKERPVSGRAKSCLLTPGVYRLRSGAAVPARQFPKWRFFCSNLVPAEPNHPHQRTPHVLVEVEIH